MPRSGVDSIKVKILLTIGIKPGNFSKSPKIEKGAGKNGFGNSKPQSEGMDYRVKLLLDKAIMSKDQNNVEANLHLAFIIDDMAGAGAEAFVLTVIESLLKKGYRIDLVLFKFQGPRLSQIPDGVNLFVLDRHFFRKKNSRQCSVPAEKIRLIHNPIGYWRTSKALFRLLRPLLVGKLPQLPPRPRDLHHAIYISEYLKTRQPDLIWAHSDSSIFSSVLSRKMSSVNVPVVWTLHYDPSFMDKKRPFLKQMIRECDIVHTVSNGAAQSLVGETSTSRSRIVTIHNPLETASILSLAEASADHEWLASDQSTGNFPKTVLAAGNFNKDKNFEMLIRAFSNVLRVTDARLIILGEGKERSSLENLARELKIDHAISMPGWVENPYSYMANSRLFVLSSNREGFARVLVEALICGCPVVSIDCPSGPREILENGKWGRLVPVGGEATLSRAMLESLGEDMDSNALRRRGMSFDVEALINHYEEFLLGIVHQNRLRYRRSCSDEFEYPRRTAKFGRLSRLFNHRYSSAASSQRVHRDDTLG